MKHNTSIKNANEVAKRLKKVTGIISLPQCSIQALRIKRAWLFGSTVKGKQNPNDTDILVDIDNTNLPYRKVGHHGCQLDREYLRRYGIRKGKCSIDQGLKYLRKNLKMVRIHRLNIDGEIAHPRIMIYPKNCLNN